MKLELDAYEGQEEQHGLEREVKEFSSAWTTRDGRKVPVTEMTDDHLQNTIAMLMRVEMPMGHDFPSEGMAAYYADQQMDHEWDKYVTAQRWLSVLRGERRRRLRS